MSESYAKVRSGKLTFKGEEPVKKKKKSKKDKKEKKAQKRKLAEDPLIEDEKLHGGWYQVHNKYFY